MDVGELVRRALEEDGAARDLTTLATVPESARARGRFLAKDDLVVSGLDVAGGVFSAVDGGLRLSGLSEEGARVSCGAFLGSVEGGARSLLRAERVALNFVQRLSGVATLTRRFVDAVAGTRAQVRDTRMDERHGWAGARNLVIDAGAARLEEAGLVGHRLIIVAQVEAHEYPNRPAEAFRSLLLCPRLEVCCPAGSGTFSKPCFANQVIAAVHMLRGGCPGTPVGQAERVLSPSRRGYRSSDHAQSRAPGTARTLPVCARRTTPRPW